MNNKTIVLAIVAILAVAAVGVGIYYVYGNEDTRGTMSFLIEDGDSDPFWIEGRGDNAETAFVDACDKNGITYELTQTDLYGAFIFSISGIEQTSDFSSYWGVSNYSMGEWIESPVGISFIKSSEVRYVALVYGGWGATPSVEP